ncbi:uncharacterized protein G2W53_014914 [Senna tora]|uniref:Uncharacterized protein n=1 Tax=Senna tora TaxID=362788 RepID=A0A834WUC7_9FABA|nr:uncharacterized protein G2W53_014914 [Senna tora]
MATGQISRRRRLVAADLAEENAEVLRESEGEEASGAAEEEVFVYSSLLSLSLNLPNTLIAGKNSHHRRRIHGHWTDLSALSSHCIGSLGTVISLQQILPKKTHKWFGRVKEKKPPPPRKRKCLEEPWPPDRSLVAVVLLHQISRRRRLVAADLTRENAEVLRESEGEEASAAAEEEVFGLEEDPWPPDRSLDVVVSLYQISRRRRLVAVDLVGENAEVPRESEGEEASAAAKEELFGLEFIGRFSLSRSTSQTLSSAAKTLTIKGGSMATGQISRCRRLVAADLAGENAEVLRESEGEVASAAAEEEVFGLEFIGRFSLSRSTSQTLSSAAKSLTIEEGSMATDRSLGAVVSLQQILPKKTQKCFGRVKEKKPPPPRKRKFLVWSLLVASLSLAQPLKHSQRRQKLSPSKEDPWPTDRSLGAFVSLHQISRRRRLIAADLAIENAEVLRESAGEEASATAEKEVFGLERQKLSPSKEDPWPPDRSLGVVVLLHKISRRRCLVVADLAGENGEKFGRVKEKKPPPLRKRKCLGKSLALLCLGFFTGSCLALLV